MPDTITLACNIKSSRQFKVIGWTRKVYAVGTYNSAQRRVEFTVPIDDAFFAMMADLAKAGDRLRNWPHWYPVAITRNGGAAPVPEKAPRPVLSQVQARTHEPDKFEDIPYLELKAAAKAFPTYNLGGNPKKEELIQFLRGT